MPNIEESSELIIDSQFEIIWDWIPSIYRLNDPKLVFTTSRDGFYLKNLYSKLTQYDEKAMLLLIKTDENIVSNYIYKSYLKIN